MKHDSWVLDTSPHHRHKTFQTVNTSDAGNFTKVNKINTLESDIENFTKANYRESENKDQNSLHNTGVPGGSKKARTPLFVHSSNRYRDLAVKLNTVCSILFGVIISLFLISYSAFAWSQLQI